MKASFEPVLEAQEGIDSTEMKRCYLQDSGLTTPTEAGSVSSEEEGWLGGIGADFRTLAESLRDTAGGVASFVHRSAMAVAAEIAQMEEEGGDGENTDQCKAVEALRLPWEILIDDNTYAEDSFLKEKILELSTQERNFMEPFSSERKDAKEEDGAFALDGPRIRLIRSLLELDEHLAATHARLSGRSDVRETIFWRNYFFNCAEVRREHLEIFGDTSDDIVSQTSLNSLVNAETISQEGDDISFICVSGGEIPSPPTSLNSAGIRSVESMVFIDGGRQSK